MVLHFFGGETNLGTWHTSRSELEAPLGDFQQVCIHLDNRLRLQSGFGYNYLTPGCKYAKKGPITTFKMNTFANRDQNDCPGKLFIRFFLLWFWDSWLTIA